MKAKTIALHVLAGALLASRPTESQEPSATKRVVIAASTVLDGRGGMLRDTHIVIEGSKIVAIDPHAEPVDYDLRGRTVLPGWIDSHVHLTWGFDRNGRNASGGDTSQFAAYQSASNAWLTLMAGFTTVQSVGSPSDVTLRDAIASGVLPGPRLLTAVQPLVGRGEATGTPEEIRAFVRRQKNAGAAVIKIFAAQSPFRPAPILSQVQLDAACEEATRVGLRTLVHAYGEAVRMATLAGCTQIEHGPLATDDDLRLMAAKGTYLDAQAGLVWENYLVNKDKFLGTPGYPAEAFPLIEKAIPISHEFMQRAGRIAGLKLVFGSDALAGSHGRNAEEFIHRVRYGGVSPKAAMISANSLAAEALRMGDRIGSIAAGFDADIIALDGDPLNDITAVGRVVFVMKGGTVYKNVIR